jgi:hypothetical protein
LPMLPKIGQPLTHSRPDHSCLWVVLYFCQYQYINMIELFRLMVLDVF